jgi:hypothetical protein
MVEQQLYLSFCVCPGCGTNKQVIALIKSSGRRSVKGCYADGGTALSLAVSLSAALED